MAVLKLSTPVCMCRKFSIPPSVAEVETAIPAFIGYTEKADRIAAGDLKLVANKVNNLSEYVQFYVGLYERMIALLLTQRSR
jgi:phage tail sheath protein FI